MRSKILKKILILILLLILFLWAHLDLNQGPTDYESVALTN